MKLIITITVTDDPKVSTHTNALNMTALQIPGALLRAQRALQAEIDALETCPYHQELARSEGQ